MTTIAVTLMLTGPLMTIGSNGSELAIIPSCTADLLCNESMVLLQNAQAPFEAFKKGDVTPNRCAHRQLAQTLADFSYI